MSGLRQPIWEHLNIWWELNLVICLYLVVKHIIESFLSDLVLIFIISLDVQVCLLSCCLCSEHFILAESLYLGGALRPSEFPGFPCKLSCVTMTLYKCGTSKTRKLERMLGYTSLVYW